MISRRLIYIILGVMCMLLMTACSWMTESDGLVEVPSYKEAYISLIFTVNDSRVGASTRGDTWWPRGGESGNGLEVGFPRENAVTGVTLILFKKSDDNGLNTTSNPTLDLIRYYPVSYIAENHRQGDAGGIGRAYWTGEQALGKNHKLDFSATYYAIAIANYYPQELVSLKEGESHLGDILDLMVNPLYSGNATLAADQCANFAMSLETAAELKFGDITPTQTSDGGDLYDMTGYAIPIERMAARIDFWAANSEGYQTKDANSEDYDAPGYQYKVYDSSGNVTDDRFVLTHITPFNLNNAYEYIFKRNYKGDDATDIQYLAPEDGEYIHVLDPSTTTKIGSTVPSNCQNPLNGILTEASLAASSYRHAVSDMHNSVWTGGENTNSGGYSSWSDTYVYDDTGVEKTATVGPAEDIIIAYPMENTLLKEAPLYYYATGIAIEGDYYTGNDKTKREHRVYYGFIRHASKTIAPQSYDALTAADFDTADKIAALKNIDPKDTDSPMHFGVVRNNIYRIHVGKVYQRESPSESPKITLEIKVKKWDKFEHAPIYM